MRLLYDVMANFVNLSDAYRLAASFILKSLSSHELRSLWCNGLPLIRVGNLYISNG
jgi:hypothetical protein